jgi:hypothetical protein
VIPQAAGMLLVLIGASTAVTAQTRGPVPQLLPPPKVYVAPTPTPQAPPTGAAPAPTPPAGLSPLLTQPGLLFGPPERASGSPPPGAVPGPVDQQKMQSYRNDLINQRFQLDRQGVSPGNERYREIQRQLNQPGSR